MMPGRGAWARLARDKADTLLLLGVALLVLAPHFGTLPLWISAGACATLLWRGVLTWRGWRMPPLWLLAPVALLAMAGVYASFKTLLGRDAGVAMLTLLLAFKLLEMHARRDLFVVVFLSYFVLLTSYFDDQGMPMAALTLLTVVLLLTAQLSFQYTGAVPPLRRRLRLAATIVAGALPLTALLFVAFPRIQGPLWSLPGDAHNGRSGMSDSMAPGSLSDLAQSNEVAFRASFRGATPAQNQRYWRGLVLGRYDGHTWTRLVRRDAAQAPVDIELRGPALAYQLTLEPQGQRWLYTLDLPERVVERQFPLPTRLSPQMELLAAAPVSTRIRYSVRSVPDYRYDPALRPDQLLPWLQLPAGFNPRTLAWAAALRQQQDTPAAAIGAVLRHFRTDSFRYTLQPPLLGRDAVDDFLFSTKAGFCEHYAGAFVVILRAMGIPARVVVGYQGGEVNPVDGYLTVRQSDAHAWAEAWLAGRGWVRLDPTAAVAPERVEHNLADALPPPPAFSLQGLGQMLDWSGDRQSLLSSLRFNLAALDNGWNQWVLDYNPERQRGLLQQLATSIAAWLADWRSGVALAVLAILVAAGRWWRQRRRHAPLDALYLAFCALHARRGGQRAPDEGPQRYAERLAALPLAPAKKEAALRFLAIYGAIKYGRADAAEQARALTTLKRLLAAAR